MEKTQFETLQAAAETTDHEAGIASANKVINKAFPDLGKVDISKVEDAHKVITRIVGDGELGGAIGNGSTKESIATFAGHSASAPTFPIAFLKVLILAIKATALDNFFTAPVPSKDKARRDGLGSPAHFGAGQFGSNY